MAGTLLLPLRVLYNLNRSRQYILARSNKKYPVSVDMAEFSCPKETECLYASASLKACLDTICCASPELVQDASRDYSVYVLDPLESQPTAGPVNVPADTAHVSRAASSDVVDQPQPVAVGLGLMSWALLADEHDSVMVNGTVVKIGTGEQVLQVIFALRDAVPIQKAALPDALRSWGLPPPPSKRSQVHASRSHHSSTSRLRKSDSQSKGSKARLSPNHLPQNVDPFGQQAAAASLTQMSHAERILDSANVYVGPPRRKAGRPSKPESCHPSDISASIDGFGNCNLADPHPIVPPFNSSNTPVENSSANVITNLWSAQNSALISVLSAIDGEDKGPALVDALKQLLSTCPQPESNSSPPTQPQTNDTKLPPDDDIIILDKENINPTAFRRRGDREDTKLSVAETMCSAASLGNKQISQPSLSSCDANVLRKRTLSEFMNHRESGLAAGPHKTRGLAVPSPHTSNSSRRSVSIPRQSASDENAMPRIVSRPATSPVRPLRRQGLPEWARTTTATQPRFSKESREYMKRKAAEAKQREKVAMKDHRAAGTGVKRVKHVLPGPSKNNIRCPERRANQSVGARQAGPLVASSITHPPIFASDLILPPSSPPPSSSPVQSLPHTPVRRNTQHKPSAYNRTFEEHSLFTPTPRSCLSDPRNYKPATIHSPLSSPTILSGRASMAARRLEKARMMGELDADSRFEEIAPSSLPIASSDIEISPSQDDAKMNTPSSDFHQWVGLPPSSPPPPTSPFIVPQDDSMSFEDMGNLLAEEAGDLADIFAQISDGSARQQHEDGGLFVSRDDTAVEFDFTEFWQSVKPLMDTRVEGQTDWILDPPCEEAYALGDIDHAKLAADVQTLFSGCLM